MTAYYNEHDPVSAEWLRRLIAGGEIPDGVVDERDIRDVAPAELVRFTQCHFFAGIGIWPLALRSVGWADDRPIWSGSSPCQPFSSAGAGAGFDDERHLWPHWHWLIQHVRPDVLVGEQVAGKDGLGWYDLVSDDLAGISYTSGAVALSAAGFGMDWRGSAEARRLERAIRLCPDPMVRRHLASFAHWADQSLGFGGFHIRERLYFVGLSDAEDGDGGTGERRAQEGTRPDGQRWVGLAGGGADGRLVNREREGLERQRGDGDAAAGREPGSPRSTAPSGDARRLGDQPGGGRGVVGDEMEPGRSRYPDGAGVPSGGLADGDGRDAAPEREQRGGQQRSDPEHHGAGGAGGRGGDGDSDRGLGTGQADDDRGDFDWLFCRDGSWRPTGPGAFPLVDANPGRMGALRAYGNALDFETAKGFCGTLVEILRERNR